MSGEKIESDNYQEKFEENILNTIEYTNKKGAHINLVFLCIIGAVIFCDDSIGYFVWN